MLWYADKRIMQQIIEKTQKAIHTRDKRAQNVSKR